MLTTLNEIERRVLGVLMEKALSQPGTYPLTLNAILVGANQKQNREPVVEYQEADIARVVHVLQTRNLVKQAPPVPGARANRFEHNAVEYYHWDRRQQAIMAELLLRGRQTVGELRTRASRLTPFSDLTAAATTMQELSSHDPPFVEELAREPGRSANRFRHLLSAEAETLEARSVSAAEAREEPAGDVESLATRVAALEARVDELSEVVESLRKNAAVPIDGSGAVDV